MSHFFDFGDEDFIGELGLNSCAISSFCISIKGAAVGEAGDAGEGSFDNGVGPFCVDVDNKAHAAGIVFVAGMVKPLEVACALDDFVIEHGLET